MTWPQRLITSWLAGGQPFDDAELEPVMVFDGERQGPHVPDLAAAEVLAADRDAGQLDQRLRRAGRPGQGLDVLRQQQPARAHPAGVGRAAGNDETVKTGAGNAGRWSMMG
jgi:hypothetical protein